MTYLPDGTSVSLKNIIVELDYTEGLAYDPEILMLQVFLQYLSIFVCMHLTSMFKVSAER